MWSGIPSVVLGTVIATLKRLGLPQIELSCEEVASLAFFGGFDVVRGVLEAECDAFFESWHGRRSDSGGAAVMAVDERTRQVGLPLNFRTEA